MNKSLAITVILSFLFIQCIGQKTRKYQKLLPEKSLQNTQRRYLGRRMAINDNIAVVSSFSGINQEGRAHVLKYIEGKWEKIATLKNSKGKPRDQFSFGLAISDDIIAISDAKSNIFVYEKPLNGWHDMTETAVLKSEQNFPAESIALNENTIIASYKTLSSESALPIVAYTKEGKHWKDMKTYSYIVPKDQHILQKKIFLEGNTLIALDKINKSIHFLNRTAKDWSEKLNVHKIEFNGPIEDFDIDNGHIIVRNNNQVYVIEKLAEDWAKYSNPTRLSPSIPLKSPFSKFSHGGSIAINDNTIMMSVAAFNSDASIYVFEKSDDKWTEMNETNIIPLPKGLEGSGTIPLVMNARQLLVSNSNFVSPNNNGLILSYNKAEDGWTDNTYKQKFQDIEGPFLAYGNERFGSAIARSDQYTLILDKGLNDHDSYNRLYIYKNKANGDLEKIKTFGVSDSRSSRCTSIAIEGNTFALATATFSERTSSCYLFNIDETSNNLIQPLGLLKSDSTGIRDFEHITDLAICEDGIAILDSKKHAYVYTKSGGKWNITPEMTYSPIKNTLNKVDITPNVLAITQKHSAIAFEKKDNKWSSKNIINLNFSDINELQDQPIAMSVDIEEDLIAVGAVTGYHFETEGRVYMFKKKGKHWEDAIETNKIISPHEAGGMSIGGFFGYNLSLENNHLIVGNTNEYTLPEAKPMPLFAFKINENGEPLEVAEILPKDNLETYSYGQNFVLSKNMLLISANHDSSIGHSSGACYNLSTEKLKFMPIDKISEIKQPDYRNYPYYISNWDNNFANGEKFNMTIKQVGN